MVEYDSLEYQTLQEYFRKIENAIQEYCTLDIFPDGFTLHTATIQQFNACLQYVSRTVFIKPIPNSKRHRTTIDTNNIYILQGLLDYYIYLCNIYSKVPSLLGYSYLIGISYNTLFDWINESHYSSDQGKEIGYTQTDGNITRLRSRLMKTITKLNESTLLERLENGSNPVGMIAAGNVVHNWDNRRAQNADNSRSIESSVISSKYLQLAEPNDEVVSDSDTISELPSNDLQ